MKKRFQCRCFPVNIAKFSRTHFFTEHLRWMLLFSPENFRCFSFLFKLLIKLTFFNTIFPIFTFFSQFYFHFSNWRCQSYQKYQNQFAIRDFFVMGDNIWGRSYVRVDYRVVIFYCSLDMKTFLKLTGCRFIFLIGQHVTEIHNTF